MTRRNYYTAAIVIIVLLVLRTAVFVVDESRLARSEGVAFAIRDHLRRAGVTLVTLTGETDLGDPEESTMSAVRTLFAVAEQYRRGLPSEDLLDHPEDALHQVGLAGRHGERSRGNVVPLQLIGKARRGSRRTRRTRRCFAARRPSRYI